MTKMVAILEASFPDNDASVRQMRKKLASLKKPYVDAWPSLFPPSPITM